MILRKISQNKKLKSRVKALFSKIEASLDIAPKIAIGLGVIYLMGLSYVLYTHSNARNIADATVMITRMDGQSGGSGVIIESSPAKTLVLTNAHVCEVATKGGLVKTVSGITALVRSTRVYALHDLCIIEVYAYLGHAAKLAKRAPEMYSEATVSGHPALLPNVVAKGHFSGTKIITVFIGIKKCTEDDISGPSGIYCVFFGGMPILRSYESMLATSMIMGGSSGSAVYNADSELSGLVFAGSGTGLSYAYIVPFEYVNDFIKNKNQYQPVIVDYTVDLSTPKSEINKSEIISKCRQPNQFRAYCKIIEETWGSR